MELHTERKPRTWITKAKLRAHVAQRWLWRHRLAVSCSLLIPVALAFIALGIVYVHYSRVIDRHVAGGAFSSSVNIYGASLSINRDDTLSATNVAADLRLAGYRESATGQPGTFSINGSTITAVPQGGDAVRIVVGAKQVEKIELNRRAVETWSFGEPLLTNLNSTREQREIVTFRQIPPMLVHAVSSIEDKHFFRHRGLDVGRIVKAAYVDFRDGRKEQGASTLTMQLVRDLYLDPDKRWRRKIAEAMMTVHLEREWSKEKIFETYANEVYMGRRAGYSVRGFAEGAQFFFGKPLSDVTLPEAAMLAGMVQRPSYFNPYRNPQATTRRRNLVLHLMHTEKYIGDDEYRDAVATPLDLAPLEVSSDPDGSAYFLDMVTNELEKTDKGDLPDNGVHTTIDLNLQRAAFEAIHDGMAVVDKMLASKYVKGGPRAEAALIAIDPHTGEIKAMVGGRDYANSQLNRIMAKRPPGSVFKPFVYAAALNTAVSGGSQTFTPASMVDDSPATFGSGRQTYQPANFKRESFGKLTFRQALAKSDNIAAVKVAQMVGYGNVVSMAQQAGLNGDIKPTPSVALGTYEVTPLEMVGAYTTFANGGVLVEPHMMAGGLDKSHQADSHRALDPKVAYLMVNMLEEVLRSGTAASVRSRGFLTPAAGKTGTSHDGWFAGFTSNLLCVVWVGFDDYRELDLEGAKSALPIWTEFMKKASGVSPYSKAKEFSQPDGIETAKICNKSGLLAGDFCTDVRNEVFISGTTPQAMCEVDLPPETILPAAVNARILQPAVAWPDDPPIN